MSENEEGVSTLLPGRLFVLASPVDPSAVSVSIGGLAARVEWGWRSRRTHIVRSRLNA